MKRLFIRIFVNVGVLFTLLIIIETCGQITYLLKTRHNAHVFELHPYLVGRPKKNYIAQKDNKEVTTTNIYTRWTGAPEDDSHLIRVAVLGGSTAFGNKVTDRDSWPALLQDKLGDRFSVINFGVPGYSTAEAIIQMALIVPEVKPQIIILNEGWNDIHNYHETDLGADYYAHGIRQYVNLDIPSYKNGNLLEVLYKFSTIGKLASKIKLKLSRLIRPCPKFDTPDPFVDRIYVRNLKTLKLLSEETATYTLLVPQVLNYESLLEMKEPEGCNEWARHIKNSALPRLMDRFNLLMQSVCPNDDSKCTFLNSVLKVKWNSQDFVDDGHLSRDGGEKLAGVISQVILSKAKEGNLYNH